MYVENRQRVYVGIALKRCISFKLKNQKPNIESDGNNILTRYASLVAVMNSVAVTFSEENLLKLCFVIKNPLTYILWLL